MSIAVQGKIGARPMIRIILKTEAMKEDLAPIAGNRASAGTAAFGLAGGRVFARNRYRPMIPSYPYI